MRSRTKILGIFTLGIMLAFCSTMVTPASATASSTKEIYFPFALRDGDYVVFKSSSISSFASSDHSFANGSWINITQPSFSISIQPTYSKIVMNNSIAFNDGKDCNFTAFQYLNISQPQYTDSVPENPKPISCDDAGWWLFSRTSATLNKTAGGLMPAFDFMMLPTDAGLVDILGPTLQSTRDSMMPSWLIEPALFSAEPSNVASNTTRTTYVFQKWIVNNVVLITTMTANISSKVQFTYNETDQYYRDGTWTPPASTVHDGTKVLDEFLTLDASHVVNLIETRSSIDQNTTSSPTRWERTYQEDNGTMQIVHEAFGPSAPLYLMVTAGNEHVMLSWQSPANNGGNPITGYKIGRSTSPGNETLLATTSNVTNYTDVNMTRGQVYYYQVTAVNGAGEGDTSNEVNATLTSSTSPPAPMPVTTTPGYPVVIVMFLFATTSITILIKNRLRLKQ